MKLTYKYRIKDRNNKKLLSKWASSVNFVWNYCKDVSTKNYKQHRKIFSNYDLMKLTAGSSKELGIGAKTIEKVCDQFAKSGKQHKKFPRWRSYKKDLGWIPFVSVQLKIKDNIITFNKHQFKVWLSRPLGGTIKCGGFAQDTSGNWFIYIVCEVAEQTIKKSNDCIGIDLGIKNKLTLSDGKQYNHENITKQYALLLAKAQQNDNARQVKKIHTKIKNIRKDWCHKTTTEIVKNYQNIYVGNLKPSELVKKNKDFNKSLYDASLYQIKTMLKYKAQLLGSNYKEVNEAYTTQTCSSCDKRTGPRGEVGLNIREWVCSDCGVSHDRDINAAKNILRIGHDPLKV